MPSPLAHNIIFFALAVVLAALKLTPSTSLNTLCLFLILSVGISHGSVDHLKGYRLLKVYGINNKLVFYLSYIFLSIFIIFCWLTFPSVILIIFLIIATYHFGKEDALFENKTIFFKFLLYGSPIILAPLSFHFEETLLIFNTLFVENKILINILLFLEDKNIFKISLVIFLLLSFYLSNKSATKGVELEVFIVEKIAIILLNWTCYPLIAFTIYFCFLHSLRHSFKLSDYLNSKNFNKGFKDFLSKALPITLITAILFIISLLILNNYYEINDVIIKVIFIGLASLTFPHILLEYLLEKNEK